MCKKSFRFSTVFMGMLSMIGNLKAQVSDNTIAVVDRAMTDELARKNWKSCVCRDWSILFRRLYRGRSTAVGASTASNGSLTKSNDHHERKETVRLLLNNYQFNDENFSDNTGLFSYSSAPDNTLPLDDDYTGMRRVLWLSTDDLFKEANENFTKKKAALEHKQLAPELKNLPDFSQAPAVQIAEPPVTLHFDRAALENMVKELSAGFATHPEIQTSSVSLTISNSYEWIENTEGTKSRKPATLCEIQMEASSQSKFRWQALHLERSS